MCCCIQTLLTVIPCVLMRVPKVHYHKHPIPQCAMKRIVLSSSSFFCALANKARVNNGQSAFLFGRVNYNFPPFLQPGPIRFFRFTRGATLDRPDDAGVIKSPGHAHKGSLSCYKPPRKKRKPGMKSVIVRGVKKYEHPSKKRRVAPEGRNSETVQLCIYRHLLYI